jgi:hypothetical protein
MQNFSLLSLKDILGDLSQVHLESWSSHDVETPFQIKPKEFLTFGEYDLKENYKHHLINSLSNIKRAIHCQIDSIMFGFGLHNKIGKLNFPDKVKKLNSFGIISPQILKGINRRRNLLEHDYEDPSNKEDIEVALDVAKLFIAYTDKYLCRAMYECEPYNDKTKESFEINLDYRKKYIMISSRLYDENGRVVLDKNGNLKKEIKMVTADLMEYEDYLKLFLSLYRLRR